MTCTVIYEPSTAWIEHQEYRSMNTEKAMKIAIPGISSD